MCMFTSSVIVTVKFSLYMMDLMIKINHEQYDKVTDDFLEAEGLVRTGCQLRESTLAKYLLYCL